MPIVLRSAPPITFTLANVAQPLSPIPVLPTDEIIYTTSVTIQADKANVGVVTVGGFDIDGTNSIQIEPRESAVIEHTAPSSFGDDTIFRLHELYALSSNAGDKIRITYMKRIK